MAGAPHISTALLASMSTSNGTCAGVARAQEVAYARLGTPYWRRGRRGRRGSGKGDWADGEGGEVARAAVLEYIQENMTHQSVTKLFVISRRHDGRVEGISDQLICQGGHNVGRYNTCIQAPSMMSFSGQYIGR